MLNSLLNLLNEQGPINVTLYMAGDEPYQLMLRYVDNVGAAFASNDEDIHFFVVPWQQIIRIDIRK